VIVILLVGVVGGEREDKERGLVGSTLYMFVCTKTSPRRQA